MYKCVNILTTSLEMQKVQLLNFSDVPHTSKSKQKNMADRLSPTRISLPPPKSNRSLDPDIGRPT